MSDEEAGLTPSYHAYKGLLAQPDVQALINEAKKGPIKNYDQAIELDHIFERRPSLVGHFIEPHCLNPTFICEHPQIMSPSRK
ncbi:unnamed protein product [Rotaria sordida]|uniref:Uncharacterized protein n=1 Tax=Rotaria sordida TaxID=392033 RepID=A0A819MD25_9BILA|nr:unnamed protein product [Rotaria sordida]